MSILFVMVITSSERKVIETVECRNDLLRHAVQQQIKFISLQN